MSEGRKKKGFAVAGFVLSLIGIIGLWIEILIMISWASAITFLTTNMVDLPIPTQEIAFYILLIMILSGSNITILGVVFSSVGIARARKGFGGKKLAIAGLILSIIVLISPVFEMIIYNKLLLTLPLGSSIST